MISCLPLFDIVEPGGGGGRTIVLRCRMEAFYLGYDACRIGPSRKECGLCYHSNGDVCCSSPVTQGPGPRANESTCDRGRVSIPIDMILRRLTYRVPVLETWALTSSRSIYDVDQLSVSSASGVKV